MLGIRNLMKPRSVGVNDTDRCLPHADLRMIFDTPKEDEFVPRFGPRWLEVPMAGRERFALGCAEDVDMNLAVLEVSGSVALFPRSAQVKVRKGWEDTKYNEASR